MGILSKAAKAAAKKAREKAKERAAEKAAKALKENQKKSFNELMSKTPAAQAEAGMGTASKTRIKRGEIGGRIDGAKKEYKRTLNKIENDPNLSDEQLEIMMGKLRDLEARYGKGPLGVSNMKSGGMSGKRKGSMDYRKGGMVLSSSKTKRGK